MALKKPEGLAPCYASLVSPDIPESMYFRWIFRDGTQKQFTIEVNNSLTGVLVHQETVISPTSEFDINKIKGKLSLGTGYTWRVMVKATSNSDSDWSIRGAFTYDSCPAGQPIVWSTMPKVNETVANAQYFADIKTNLTILGQDYGLTSYWKGKIDSLFLGQVVPSRKDWEVLKEIIEFMSQQNEKSNPVDPVSFVKDSLGTSDISRVRAHIDYLAQRPPQAVETMWFDIPQPSMYTIQTFNVNHDGKDDRTVDANWSVSPMPQNSGNIRITDLSPSGDVRYYKVVYEYGYYPANMFRSVLYFKYNMFDREEGRGLDVNWTGLHVSGSKPMFKWTMTTVDKRGNESWDKSTSYTFNGQVPLGVDYYEFMGHTRDLSATSYDVNGFWWLYTRGTNTSASYTFSEPAGHYWNRVRAVDKSGLVTPWVYSRMLEFDPLKPPDRPNITWTDSDKNSVSYGWPNAARAEWYEVQLHWNGGTTKRIWDTWYKWGGLSPNGYIDVHVRAGNRAGVSDWATIGIKTKTGERINEFRTWGSRSWRDKIVYPSRAPYYGKTVWCGWRDEAGGERVYHGQWTEIDSPHRAGPLGTKWGKNKGFWFFDVNAIRNATQGRRIVKVEMLVQRRSYYHGYYNDQSIHFWNHNYSDIPWWKWDPEVFNHHHVTNPVFDLGQRSWVTLPNSFVENIRDGWACGIALFVPNWAEFPYVQMESGATLRIKTDD